MNPRGELNDCQFPKPVYFLNFAPIYLLLYAQICVGLFPTPKKPLLFFFSTDRGSSQEATTGQNKKIN